MQLDVVDVMARLLALVILLAALSCIVMIWMAATGHPAFHIPWVEVHETTQPH